MIWIFILGLIFCAWGGYFLIDFIKNNKKIYDTFSEKEGIPISYYRQLISSMIGIFIGLFFILRSFGIL